MKINLLRKKGTPTDGKNSNGDKNSLKRISSHSFREGLYISGRPAIAKRTASRTKAYVIVIVSAISAFYVGYLFSVRSFAYGTVALLIFTTIFIIQTLLLRKTSDIILVVILDALGFSFFLTETSFITAAYLLIILGIIFVLAHVSNGREADNMVQLKFFRAVRPGTGWLLVALSVFIGLVLFINGGMLLKKEGVARVINAVGRPILSGSVENFSAEMRLDEFLKSYIKTELNKGDDFRELSKFKQEIIIDMQTDNLTIYITERTGYKLQMDKSVAENVQEFISTKAEALYPKSQLAQLVIVILILIITVKSIEFLFFPVFALLGLMVYELLIGFGFVEVQFESRSKEALNLPTQRS
jgi:hypothetical protein